MTTYVVYYTVDGERYGFEVGGVKALKAQIKQVKAEGGNAFEVYKVNDLNDRDDVTLMECYR